MKIYVVRNSDGQYFRSKGFGGYGKTWVDKLESARLYTKLGQAKSRVTWFAREYPKFPAPSIVSWELDEKKPEVMDMAGYAEERIRAIEIAQAKQKRRDFEYRKERIQFQIDALNKEMAQS